MNLIALREPVSAWTHCAWLALSIPATILLWRRCRGDRPRQISVLTYGVGLAACYAGSALFHGARVEHATLDLLDRMDHIGIYLLIAGTYTPLAWNMMRDHWRAGVLASVWGAAFFGSVLLVFQGVLPPIWSTTIYLVMGWGAIFCYLELLRIASHRTLFPLMLGGVLYSVGAALNLLRWPNPFPGLVGPHEIFHLFVMAGSLAHFVFILEVVVKHRRPAAASIPAAPQAAPRPVFSGRRAAASSLGVAGRPWFR